MGGQEANDRRRYCTEGDWTLHEVCDDYSAARGPSQRFRYLAHSRTVQPVTAGVYATVHGGGGTIRRGDQVRLEG
jgi:hypothetical protein